MTKIKTSVTEELHKILWEKDPLIQIDDDNGILLFFDDDDDLILIKELLEKMIITNPTTGKLRR